MSEPSHPAGQEELVALVHDALSKLYDSTALQNHPLGHVLTPGQANPVQRSQDMRRTLLACIHALRPVAGTPAHSPDWRAYRLLELRYIEGLDPTEVMARLGLAKSQYYREQSRITQVLATVVQTKCQEALAAPARQPSEEVRRNMIRAEAARISAQSAREGIDDAELLADLAAVIEPLAREKGITMRLVSMASLRGLPVNRVVLRQALLVALSSVLNLPGTRLVEVTSTPDPAQRLLSVRASPRFDDQCAAGALAAEALTMCQSFMETMDGALSISHATDTWELRLTWPWQAPRKLLVIDDNDGLIDLFQRYLSGHAWRVIGANDGLEARQILASTQPDVIILDVMMPREDGWEFLLAVKSSLNARGIPIIICSVLNQPEIARTLGASAYVPKPVSQQALIEVLAPWSHPPVSPLTKGGGR